MYDNFILSHNENNALFKFFRKSKNGQENGFNTGTGNTFHIHRENYMKFFFDVFQYNFSRAKLYSLHNQVWRYRDTGRDSLFFFYLFVFAVLDLLI